MAFESFYITSKGKRLLAKAQIGTAISFTKAQIGQGDLPENTDILSLTGLIQPVKVLPISGLRVGKEDAQITIGFSNQDISIPFYWKEIGLYATDPDEGEILYAYGHAGSNADYISAYSTSPMEFIFTMIVQIGSAANITAVIDTSLVYCTLDHEKDISHSFYGVTTAGGTGTSADKILAVSIPGLTLQDGLNLRLKLHADIMNGATLNLNSLGAKSILLGNGDPVTSGTAAAGDFFTLSYSAAKDAWVVEGGNALPISGGTATGPIIAGGTQDIATSQVRNISAGTTDLTAGTSALATGSLYLVYE